MTYPTWPIAAPPINHRFIQTGEYEWVHNDSGRYVRWDFEQGVYQAYDYNDQAWYYGWEFKPGWWDWARYPGQRVAKVPRRDRPRTMWDTMWLSALAALAVFIFSVHQGVGAEGAIVAVYVIARGFAWNWFRMRHPVAADLAEVAMVASFAYRGAKWFNQHSR